MAHYQSLGCKDATRQIWLKAAENVTAHKEQITDTETDVALSMKYIRVPTGPE